MLSRSVVSDSVTPWTAASQAYLSVGILQARILKWVPLSFSRGLSLPRDQTRVSLSPAMAGQFFTTSATLEGKPENSLNQLSKVESKL